MKPILFVAALLCCSPLVSAQPETRVGENPLFPAYRYHDLNARPMADSSLYKRRSNWQQIVDQFWGPGLSLSQKQLVFNTFANYIHDRFPGFGGLNVNWDSLRAFYAQQITDSTRRGGFSAILSRLAHDMHDFHVMGWDTIMRTTPLNPGVPIFVLSLNQGDVRHFGAVLSPLPDSSLLVVRAVAGHPLNLQPGDIVVGYEGVPWKRLAFELLDSPLPQMGPMGSSESARIHQLLSAVGLNWHLFDTIDVIRYLSGAAEHLPTSPLSSLSIPEYMPNNEQLPVPSVPQPDYDPFLSHANNVSYGIIEGTNIGYIYISGHGPGTRNAFGQAVAALMGTEGLIIDIRFNNGGFVSEGPEAGLALLMNHSTQTLIGLERSSPADLYALKPLAPSWLQAFSFEADPNTLYDRPIAVLVGPFAVSQGDFTAYKFRYLPGARFFGKSVNGAVSGMVSYEPVVNGFFFMVPFFVLADHREPNVVLLRKELPVDEPVWLETDDVALGDDTVVKRALAWITGVAHTHQVAVSTRYRRPGVDTVRLTGTVVNPGSHGLSVMARYMADTTAVDSTLFADDGLHGDGAAGDGVWGTSWKVPAGERFYGVTTRVIDPADSSTYSMPYSARFTTAGPIAFRNMIPERVTQKYVAFRNTTVHNHGSHLVVPGVTGRIRKLKGDTVIDTIYNAKVTYGDIPPDSIVSTVTPCTLTLLSTADTVRIELGVDFASNAYTYWSDTLAFLVGPVVGVAEQLGQIPTEYALHQNYPNPFNPSTTIKYALPKSMMVRLSVYDILGREVSVLVKERRDAGVHEVKFDGSNLASAVYVYRLQSGDFVQSKRLVLLR